MNELELQFHTAVFGGFQKQDVLTYLETSALENTQKIAGLQREIEEASEARGQAENRADEAQSRISRLERENRELNEALFSQEEFMAQLKQELAERNAERDSLKQELSQLNAQLEALRPLAEGYEAIKDRTAGIELEAHGRAQIIEREAKEKAQSIREEMDGWCNQLRDSYTKLQHEAEASLSRVSQEIQVLGQNLSQISVTYQAQEKILDKLQSSVELITGPKVPQPIPPEEM